MARRFDVVVAGGGSAGCALAARLSEEPARTVCLVEAGPDYGPYDGGAWPDDLLDARRLAFSHSWATAREDRSQLRARVLGGCSAHNACVVLEGAPEDYDEWGPGWSYADLEPYLRRAETTLRTRRLTRDELSPWHAAFAEAAGDDAILHPVNAAGTVRWNAAFAYLDPARGRPNLTILAETVVDRVVFERGRAIGVTTAAGAELRAATVVLTAGAYGSPAILLRSGVGPESGLTVGENLTDHVGCGVGWKATPLLQQRTDAFAAERPVAMAQVTVPWRSSGCPEGLSDVFLFPALDEGSDGWEISAAVFCMKPRSRGRVGLVSRDPEAPLAIDHGFLRDERDVSVVAEGVAALRELAASEAVSPYTAGEERPGPDADLERYVRASARGFFHPVGTCALGAVTDERARVRGFDDLLVADASIMPTIPRANTNLTAVAVGERVAELLAATA